MVKEKELTDKVEKVDDVVEDIVEELEDLGLINEKLANYIRNIFLLLSLF